MPGVKAAKNWYTSNNAPKYPDWYEIKTDKSSLHKENDCFIQQMIQKEIDDGVPLEKRTKVFSISCPCRSCTPYSL